MATSMPSWFEFLRIEAELAMTFINTAKLHSNQELSRRCLRYAREALGQIQSGLMNPAARGLNETEVVFLEQRRVEIERELEQYEL